MIGDADFPYSGITNKNFSPKEIISSADASSVYNVEQIVQKYFPDGMKSAGSVYDSIEVDEDGAAWAVHRIGVIDCSSVTFGTLSQYPYGVYVDLAEDQRAASSTG